MSMIYGNINRNTTVTVTATVTVAEFKSLCNNWMRLNRIGRVQVAQTTSHTFHGILDVDDVWKRQVTNSLTTASGRMSMIYFNINRDTCLQVHGILDVDDVLTREGLICKEVLHESGLDVQLFHSFPGIHIARRAYRHDVSALCEHLHNTTVLES